MNVDEHRLGERRIQHLLEMLAHAGHMHQQHAIVDAHGTHVTHGGPLLLGASDTAILSQPRRTLAPAPRKAASCAASGAA